MLLLSTAVAAFGVLIYTAIIREVGRKRGRELPWGIPFKAEPPQFVDPRKNATAGWLYLLSILGFVLMGGVIGYAIGTRDEGWTGVESLLSGIGYVLVFSRSLYVLTAWAYADIESLPATQI